MGEKGLSGREPIERAAEPPIPETPAHAELTDDRMWHPDFDAEPVYASDDDVESESTVEPTIAAGG